MRLPTRRLVVLLSLVVLLVFVSVAVAAPIASFEFTPASPKPGEQVTFTSTSSSSGAAIDNYEWDLDGDGAFGEPGEPAGSSATMATRSFPAQGDYRVQLRVTDRVGAQDTHARVVRVRDPQAPPPPPSPGGSSDPPVESIPLPGGDGDGDGVSNMRDVCPTTPAGVGAVRGGCALVEFIVAPAALVGLAGESVAEARKLSRGFKTLARATRRLADNPCGASRKAGAGLRLASKAVRRIDKATVRAQARLIKRTLAKRRKQRRESREAGEFELRLYGLEIRKDRAHEALKDIRFLRRLVQRVCRDARGTRTGVARVEKIDGTSSLVYAE